MLRWYKNAPYRPVWTSKPKQNDLGMKLVPVQTKSNILSENESLQTDHAQKFLQCTPPMPLSLPVLLIFWFLLFILLIFSGSFYKSVISDVFWGHLAVIQEKVLDNFGWEEVGVSALGKWCLSVQSLCMKPPFWAFSLVLLRTSVSTKGIVLLESFFLRWISEVEPKEIFGFFAAGGVEGPGWAIVTFSTSSSFDEDLPLPKDVDCWCRGVVTLIVFSTVWV